MIITKRGLRRYLNWGSPVSAGPISYSCSRVVLLFKLILKFQEFQLSNGFNVTEGFMVLEKLLVNGILIPFHYQVHELKPIVVRHI